MKKIILLLGNSHFAKKIISEIQFEGNGYYFYCDTSNNIWDAIKYVLLIPFSSIVYSISGTINPGYALQLALFLKKKIFLHYVGSDVTGSIKDLQLGRYSQDLMSHANFAANAPWLVDELIDIGITAKFIPTYVENDPYISSVKKKFSVLTYLGEDKENFYGLQYILHLAEVFPGLEINVIGTNNHSIFENFQNIQSHGWQSRGNLLRLVNENLIMIRMTEHDGLAHLAVDAMLCKNWVIRPLQCDGVINAKNQEEMIRAILDLQNLWSQQDDYACNDIGFRWALENCSKNISLKRIKDYIFDS